MSTDEIEHIRSERPSASTAALAARSGLGDWIDTLATKQGFGWRKTRDWRLYFFTDGLVVTAPDGYTADYHWGTVRVLQYRTSVNHSARDACSTLIDPAGNALNIGFGRPPLFKAEKAALGITSWVNGAGFLYPHMWGDHIQDRVTRAQLSATVERVQRGEKVNFGPYTVDRQGVSDRKYAVAWPELTELGLHSGTLILNGSQRRSTAPEMAKAYVIPNLDLFMRLCLHLSPHLGN
ncbi:DUF6585 family protein [Streptomyces sp. NPDC053493]|uniref:DUF6585 family protein n=1 Tax=Streptomyces sp. NPDC053493 TaxID=3365705 RepID=UPI0037D78BFF